MRIDTLALQMRPRAPHEAADLGVRLCQTHAGEVYRCFLVVAIPVALLALSLFEIAPWLALFAMWWSKPWLDRTVLFVLARAAFGQKTTVGDLWRAQREVWWSRFFVTWTWCRLSPWRSFTQAVFQLEGHSLFQLRRRVAQLRRRRTGAAFMMTMAFLVAQLCLAASLVSLLVWFGPQDQTLELRSFFDGTASFGARFFAASAYMLSALLVEPLYVAAGFGMYLNRRTELEAWDIEQEFRRAFT